VDPFIGTGGHGHVYPGATVPWGMVQLSPDQGQQGWDWIAGYNWEDSLLVGFSHTHLSGTGIGDLLDILVMPVSHYVPLDVPIRDRWDRAASSRFSHDREEASPGYYAVDLLDQEIRAELTATARVGVHRYTFPETEQPALFLDLGYAINWDAPVQTSVRVVSDTLVTGYRFSRGWARDQRVFFAMAFSRPVRHLGLADSATALGIFSGHELTAGDVGATALAIRTLFAFDPMAAGETLLLKVGLSYVDEAGALANLKAEAPHWDFDLVREEARRAWERELRKVHVQGGTEAERRTFYTALYRTRLAPILFQDVDGRYRGADGRIHTAEGYRKHAIFSLWDTFRAQHPLLTLIDPDRVDDLVNSMLSFHDEYGSPAGLVPGGQRDQHHDGAPRPAGDHRCLPEGVPGVRRGEGPGGHGEERHRGPPGAGALQGLRLHPHGAGGGVRHQDSGVRLRRLGPGRHGPGAG
jgi:predicted alpha-1,2-mannosidase